MKIVIATLLFAAPFFATAEEKNCSVKGMHCEACISMVKDKVCNDSYEVCDVTLKGKSGMVHLKTKDAAGKIDAKELSKVMADTTYSVDKCTPVKGKG